MQSARSFRNELGSVVTRDRAVCHADAAYDIARKCADEHGVIVPMRDW